MSTCDFDHLITMYETTGLDKDMKEHVNHCRTCRNRLERFIALTGAMMLAGDAGEGEEGETIASLPGRELPPMLKDQVAARKKKWLHGQVANILDFKKIRDRNDRQAIIDRLLQDEPVDLPRAAFPDELDD